jgi:TP901 family phage tail tape measure protein
MNDRIGIDGEASGSDAFLRMADALDRIDAALGKLAETAGGALSRMDQQFKTMQASIATSMAAAAAEAESGSSRIAAAHESAVSKVLTVEQRRDVELNRMRGQALNDYVSWWDQMLAIEEKRDTELNRMRQQAAQDYIGWWEKSLAERNSIEQRRDVELNQMAQKATTEYVGWWEKAAAEREAIEQKRDTELHAMRAREQADYAAWWNKELAIQEAGLERQRTLNTSFLTSSPAAQVRTATQAQVYAGLGGDAQAKYGSVASQADALSLAQARLAASGAALRGEQTILNDTLRQAEGAFRGAAHQAGIYGLNHGQLIALLAGGALAASLHHIAETGAEVEYQLASLNALSGEAQPIDVDKFIGISAGTLTSLKDAAEGVHALAEAGMDQQQAFAALPSVMRLSVLGEMSVAQAAEMAVESMHAFGKSVSDLESIGDILVAVGAKSNVSVHKLAEDMKSAATTGELFGMSMEEITAAVGTLAERGLTIQPLSSAMMKLYEPSDKAAKVIQKLGLEVKDQETGAFRPFTDIITDLSIKLNQFSSSGAADTLKQMGFSSRDIKAMEAMTQHLGDYKHLLEAAHDSQGKMFDAMLVKEDTVEGGWKRLGSTLDGSVVKAFEAASPVIRQVENDLMHMAGSQDTIDMLAGLASGVARLSQVVVEHTGIIALAAAGYVALRGVATVTKLIGEFAAAQRVATIATEAARVAAAAEGAQLSLLAEQEAAAAVGAGALAAETTALEARMAVAATGSRLLSASLGWLGLAATAAITVYELMSGKMSAADAQRQKEINTHETTIDAFDREIKRLNDMADQLDKVGEASEKAAGKLAMVHLQSDRDTAEQHLRDLRAQSPGGSAGYVGDLQKMQHQKAIEEAQADLTRIDDQITEQGQRLADLDKAQQRAKEATDRKSISERLTALTDSLDTIQKVNPKAAPALQEEVDKVIELTNAKVGYGKVLEQIGEVEKHVNAAKLAADKPTNDKDALNAQLALEQGKIRLAQLQAKSELDSLKSQNSRGELGDLELINEQLRVKKQLTQDEVTVAQNQARLAKGADKLAKTQAYNNKIKEAEFQNADADRAAEDARANLLDKMSKQELQYQAKTLADRGQLVDAFNMKYEADYSNMLEKLDKDIANKKNAEYKDQLERYKSFLLDLKVAGEEAALFQEMGQAFDLALAQMQNKLQGLRNNSGDNAGLGAIVDNAGRMQGTFQAALPDLLARQHARMGAAILADNPAEMKAAEEDLKKIQAQAEQVRNIWGDVAKTIGAELASAFGRGGKGIGDMLVATESYGARMAQIQDNLAKDGDKKKAAEDVASAQIKGYGDMAAAAEGFFDTSSRGYKVLRTTEQVFRAWELALAIEALAKKTFLKEAEVAVNTTTNATKIAGEAAATGASVGLAATESSAWGATAVIKAIASLPFPLNLAAGAATMAAVVALGAKLTGGLTGGHADTTAIDRQAAVGAGSILGDTKAKSDSIAKALDAIDKNTFQGLNVSMGMLDALRAIQSSVSTLGDTLYQNGLSTTAYGSSNPYSGVSKLGGAALGGSVGFMAGEGLTAFTAMASLGGPLGALAGAVIGTLLGPTISKITNSIFGGKVSSIDTGIMLSSGSLGGLLANGAHVNQYSDTKTDGGWFGKDKYGTSLTGLGAEVDDQFTKVIANMRAAIIASAGVLGTADSTFTTKLDSFVVDIGKISTKDLKPDEVQKALQAAMSKLGDDMARFAMGDLQKFQKAGEGALQTLARIANDYQTVDTVLGALGMTFNSVGMASVDARERLIDLAGGLDKFTSASEQFLKDFYTDQEQAAALRARIAPVLSQYGLSTTGADPMKAYRDYVAGLDTSTEDGAQAYTTLISISSAFKQIVDAGKKVTDEAKGLQDQLDQLTMTRVQLLEKERNALDPANQALFDQLQLAKGVADAKDALSQAYDNESQKIQQAIDRMKSFGDGLKKFRDQLALGNLSPLTPEQKYVEARNQYELTLARAKGGDTAAQDNLQNAAQAFLEASRTIYASGDSYTSDYQRVTAAMDDMSKWADQQVNVQRSSLDQLKLVVGGIIDLKGGVMTVAEAIDNLRLAQNSTSTDLQRTGLTDLYQELLGRAPDQAGLNFWMQQLQNGVTFNTIADFFKNSPEYAAHQSALSLVGNDVSMASTLSGLNTQIAALNQQVADLKTGQTQQTGALIQALAATSENAADTIVDGTKAATQEAAWSSANTVELR